jgi:hypothetical protein
MSKARKTLQISGCGGGSVSLLFYKDETGNLGTKEEVLFYQPWGLLHPEDTWRSMCEQDDKPSQLPVKAYKSCEKCRSSSVADIGSGDFECMTCGTFMR